MEINLFDGFLEQGRDSTWNLCDH